MATGPWFCLFTRAWIVVAFLLALAGCGEEAPVAETGPGLSVEIAARFHDGPLPARELAFSVDGRLLASTNADGTVNLRRLSDLRIVTTVSHGNGATSVAFDPRGRWFVTGGYDGTVRAWSIDDGKPLRTFVGHEGTVWAVDVSPDGINVVSAGEDKHVRVWDATTAKPLAALAGHALNVWDVRYSPDGSRIASAGFDRVVKLWDARDHRLVRTLSGHAQAVVGLDYSADGQWLATGSDDSTVRLWHTRDGALARTLPHHNHAYAVAFSADGRWLAAGGRARSAIGTLLHDVTGLGADREAISVWRLGDGALVRRIAAPADVVSVAFSPDGAWLAAAGEDSSVTLWSLVERSSPK